MLRIKKNYTKKLLVVWYSVIEFMTKLESLNNVFLFLNLKYYFIINLLSTDNRPDKFFVGSGSIRVEIFILNPSTYLKYAPNSHVMLAILLPDWIYFFAWILNDPTQRILELIMIYLLQTKFFRVTYTVNQQLILQVIC